MCRTRFMKIVITNMCRRYKFLLFSLGLLFFLCSLMIRLTNQSSEKPKSWVNLQYVTVHLDLKGTPPKLGYIKSLLPILSQFGVNAILVEYEDMFPYEGNILNISAVNAYKRSELLRFINYARDLDIEIIPLIQTFGHMEYVLKYDEFAHLREQEKIISDICPSNPSSRELISTMLQQVIEFHSINYPLKHIHVGCDEVWKINMCPKCKARGLETTVLFADHVEEVTSIVREISPTTNVLIWGDMLLQIKTPQKLFSYNIEAVAWEYGAHPQFSHTFFYNLHKNFNNIWIASAFKGADGRDATIPNITRRFQNHLSWIKFILDYKFGGESKAYNFKGIILTGWSRYNHMAPQCEILPLAMPSLILNLLLIRTVKNGFDKGDLDNLNYCQFFQKYLSNAFSSIFQNYKDTDEEDSCAFENTFLYRDHKNFFDLTLFHDCLSNLHTHESECRKGGAYVDLITFKRSIKLCRSALKTLSIIKEHMESIMTKYYKKNVVKSYINDIVQVPAKKVRTQMNYLKNCTKHRY